MVDSPRYLNPSGDCHFPNGEKRVFHQTHIYSCAILQELLCASLEEYASADCCSANTGARTGKRATRELGKSFKDLKIHHGKKTMAAVTSSLHVNVSLWKILNLMLPADASTRA